MASIGSLDNRRASTPSLNNQHDQQEQESVKKSGQEVVFQEHTAGISRRELSFFQRFAPDGSVRVDDASVGKISLTRSGFGPRIRRCRDSLTYLVVAAIHRDNRDLSHPKEG